MLDNWRPLLSAKSLTAWYKAICRFQRAIVLPLDAGGVFGAGLFDAEPFSPPAPLPVLLVLGVEQPLEPGGAADGDADDVIISGSFGLFQLQSERQL